MDTAYDHIQEDSFSPTSEKKQPALPTSNTNAGAENDAQQQDTPSSTSTAEQAEAQTLKTEFESAFNAAKSSQWGTTLGSWFSTARKQGETFVQDLQKEATEAQQQASKGFTTFKDQMVQRTRSLSLNAEPGPESSVPGEEALPIARTASSAEASAAAEAEALQDQMPAESLPADIVKEAGSLVASLRLTAASKLKDLQRAEDAADEALLKFGTNVKSFLRDAVTITAPDEGERKEGAEVLFETQEPGTGKKVFHPTRLDAQLHAIHTTMTSFTEDPGSGEEWDKWQTDFDVDNKTDDIARDLERYEELRRAMEKLVPEKVEYKAFWMRYYFLRKAVEEEEKRRREVLKGAAAAPDAEEEVAWDNDDDEEQSSTPSNNVKSNHAASASTTTLTQPTNDSLKPTSPRRSHEDEKSVADSDASYDIVSGAPSRGSPKDEKKDLSKDDSDDDWE